jgi:hypothetical protein
MVSRDTIVYNVAPSCPTIYSFFRCIEKVIYLYLCGAASSKRGGIEEDEAGLMCWVHLHPWHTTVTLLDTNVSEIAIVSVVAIPFPFHQCTS